MGRIDLYPRLVGGLSVCQIVVVAASRLRSGDEREGGEEREPCSQQRLRIYGAQGTPPSKRGTR